MINGINKKISAMNNADIVFHFKNVNIGGMIAFLEEGSSES